ncbi:MAG TPA: hypothetical protein VGS96_02235 [Thermoanaerobaculia bacterium]|jgi:hypothetical protein|nr:hypothetical protein [Thermoanaerobaculia bacterium]
MSAALRDEVMAVAVPSREAAEHNRWWLVAGAGLTVFMAVLDVNVALPVDVRLRRRKTHGIILLRRPS